MTAEELWEKKEMVGIGLVLLIFASGFALFKYSKGGGENATGTLIQIRQIGEVTKAYDIEVVKKETPLFKERITDPVGKLTPITDKKPGDSFKVTYQILPGGKKILATIGKNIPKEGP